MALSEPVVVVAHWHATAASIDAVLALLPELRAQSLAEPGCLGYEAFRGLDEPTTLVLIEHYRDDDAFDAHVSSPHYQEVVIGRIRPLLADRRVELLRPRDVT